MSEATSSGRRSTSTTATPSRAAASARSATLARWYEPRAWCSPRRSCSEAYRADDPVLTAEAPPYLAHDGPPWPDEYPQDFRELYPTVSTPIGHALAWPSCRRVWQRRRRRARCQRGYFVDDRRRRYDFHDHNGTPRGLVLEILDPLHRDPSERRHDHRLRRLPVAAHRSHRSGRPDHAGHLRLSRPAAEPSHRPERQPVRLYLYAAGAPGKHRRHGQGRAKVAIPAPSRRAHGIRLPAFTERGQPISVRTIRHVHHDTEMDVPLPKPTRRSRPWNIRMASGACCKRAPRAKMCGSATASSAAPVLPADQTDAAAMPSVGAAKCRTRVKPPMSSSAAGRSYDNKGQVVEKYEPFFSEAGITVARRPARCSTTAQSTVGQKATMFYDPRGQVIRTVNPDGSRAAGDLRRAGHRTSTKPDMFEPTPWEAYTYDANDNAGRTHPWPNSASGTSIHWNTPASIVIDALGRTIESVERNGPIRRTEWYHAPAHLRYPGQRADRHRCAGARGIPPYLRPRQTRPLRIDSIDAGLRRTVLDALGNVIEQRDSKGALDPPRLRRLNRPLRLWARDGRGSADPARALEYGDGGTANQPGPNGQPTAQ